MPIVQESKVYYALECDECYCLTAWCASKEMAEEIAARDYDFKTIPPDTVLCPRCAKIAERQ
jgi:hypothetical protein